MRIFCDLEGLIIKKEERSSFIEKNLIKNLEKKKQNFVVVAHNIRSCFNVGSIFRTCDGIGVDKIYITGYTADPKTNNKITKTSLGAENFVDWERRSDVEELVHELRRDGYQICSLELKEHSHEIISTNFSKNIALILGNEIDGVDSRLLLFSDLVVHIPMKGKKESLNVSVAFGIASFVIKNKLLIENDKK